MHVKKKSDNFAELHITVLYNWSESCCLGEEFVPHPGSYRSALSTGLAAGVVLSIVWVRVQAGGGGALEILMIPLFFGCGTFDRMEHPLVCRLQRDMPSKRRDTPNNEYL